MASICLHADACHTFSNVKWILFRQAPRSEMGYHNETDSKHHNMTSAMVPHASSSAAVSLHHVLSEVSGTVEVCLKCVRIHVQTTLFTEKCSVLEISLKVKKQPILSLGTQI